jgi:large subunit ribosomal protein L47
MKSIKHALTERFYTWEDAVGVAQDDPEVDMNAGEGEAYIPSTYEDDVTTIDGHATQEGAPSQEDSQGVVPGTEAPAKEGAKLEKQTV